jgi:REP element-mobilizing transposase RayT
MCRGNERRAIFRDDDDRQRRLDWRQRTVETYGGRLHAFVRLGNHDHFFLETPQPNLSAGMHLLNGSYTGYFNLRQRRVGHLFQGPFKAHLIEQDCWAIGKEIRSFPSWSPCGRGLRWSRW